MSEEGQSVTWAWLAASQEAEIRIKELGEEILGVMCVKQHRAFIKQNRKVQCLMGTKYV